MDMFPVVCALLSFVLIGPSDAKVVTLNLSSSIVGERKNFYGTCNGPCGQVNVTALSGKPRLFLAKKTIPYLQWIGTKYSGSVGCRNCFNKVTLVSFKSCSSFGLSVLTTTLSDIVKVEAANLKDIEDRIFPSKTVKFGTLTHKKDRTAKFTCYGPCQQVLAYATASVKYTHWFLTKTKPWPGTGSGGICGNCVCLRSFYNSKTNTCQFRTLDSNSFYVMYRGFRVQKNVTLTVEASNLVVNLDMSTKIPLSSKTLNLSSSLVGERKNFYGTCNGPCSQVNVKAVSGNPQLFLAKKVIPFLQWSDGSVGCTNCLKKVIHVSFKNSSSFGLSVLKTKSSDIVKVEAANLKDIKERIFPSKILNLTSSRVGETNNFNVTCDGPCSQVNVTALSGKPRLFLAKKGIPCLQWSGGSVGCTNCLKNVFHVSYKNSNSFGLSVLTTTLSDIVKVEAANLKNVKEFNYLSKICAIDQYNKYNSTMEVVTLKLGSAIKGERRNFNVTCNGTCKGVSAILTALSGFPHLYGANDSLPHPGYCDNCFCRVKNVCQNISFQGSSSFVISVVAYTDYLNATLTIEALNLEKTTEIIFPSKRLNIGKVKKGNKRNFKVTCNGSCKQVSAFVRATSGSPILHGAENSAPVLDDDKRCNNCFCESVDPWWLNICQYKSFETSSSLIFSVTALTDYENAYLMVESINFKNIEEITNPFRVLNLTSSRVGERRNFFVSCHGQCGQVDVTALSGNPHFYLATKSIPFLQWGGGGYGSVRCKNCLKEGNLVSLDVHSSSFALTVPTTKSSDIVKLAAPNIKNIKEFIYLSKTVNLGSLTHMKERQVKFLCNGACREVHVDVTTSSGIPEWFLNNKKLYPGSGSGGMCGNCLCYKTAYFGEKNRCQFTTLPDSSSFYVLYRGYTVQTNIQLTVSAFNLKGYNILY